MEVNITQLNDKLHFEATNADGNTVHMDGGPAVGGEGKGMRPMELLLTAVASCSAFDVVSILKKQREPLENLSISAKGERVTEGDVKPFISMHFVFKIKGDVNQKKADRAVQLAVEKYCSVGATLNPDIPVTYETVIGL